MIVRNKTHRHAADLNFREPFFFLCSSVVFFSSHSLGWLRLLLFVLKFCSGDAIRFIDQFCSNLIGLWALLINPPAHFSLQLQFSDTTHTHTHMVAGVVSWGRAPLFLHQSCVTETLWKMCLTQASNERVERIHFCMMGNRHVTVTFKIYLVTVIEIDCCAQPIDSHSHTTTISTEFSHEFFILSQHREARDSAIEIKIHIKIPPGRSSANYKIFKLHKKKLQAVT